MRRLFAVILWNTILDRPSTAETSKARLGEFSHMGHKLQSCPNHVVLHDQVSNVKRGISYDSKPTSQRSHTFMQ